jgi:hypothetical protein
VLKSQKEKAPEIRWHSDKKRMQTPHVIVDGLRLYTLELSPVGDAHSADSRKADGIHVETDDEGEVIFKDYWLEGLRHGTSTYMCQGRKLHEVRFFGGKRSGEEIIYNSLGDCIYKALWVQDVIRDDVRIQHPLNPDKLFLQIFVAKNEKNRVLFPNGNQELLARMNWDVHSPYLTDIVMKLLLAEIKVRNMQRKSEHRRITISEADGNISARTSLSLSGALRDRADSDTSSVISTQSLPAPRSAATDRPRTVSMSGDFSLRSLTRSLSQISLTSSRSGSGIARADDEESVGSSVSASSRWKKKSAYPDPVTVKPTNDVAELKKSGIGIRQFYEYTDLCKQRNAPVPVLNIPGSKVGLSPPISPTRIRPGDVVIEDAVTDISFGTVPMYPPINPADEDFFAAINNANKQAEEREAMVQVAKKRISKKFGRSHDKKEKEKKGKK